MQNKIDSPAGTANEKGRRSIAASGRAFAAQNVPFARFLDRLQTKADRLQTRKDRLQRRMFRLQAE